MVALEKLYQIDKTYNIKKFIIHLQYFYYIFLSKY